MIDATSLSLTTATSARIEEREREVPPSVSIVGFWAGLLATTFSVIYIVGQLAEWLGWLGSQGGAESTSTVLGIVVLLTPSFLLGSSFLVLMVSVHQIAWRDDRVWSSSAIAFATMYAVLTGTVYFVQLTLVAPRLASGRMEGIEMFRFVPFDSLFYSIDLLGYSFMSVATLFAARVVRGDGVERIARLFLTANGLLVPFLVFQLYYHSLIWIASLWAITFPAAMWSLAVMFRRAGLSRFRQS